MPVGPLVLSAQPNAPWLPVGGRAEVVLADPSAPTPRPTVVVRLLATWRKQILVEPRPDGRGLDLPSRLAGDQEVEVVQQTLVTDTLGLGLSARLLGYVRNEVPHDAPSYPWPQPVAFFCVWHADLRDDFDGGDGAWLGGRAAHAELQDRHWWPLAAHVATDSQSAAP